MKKILLSFLFLLSTLNLIAQGKPSETNIYKDVTSYASTNFYAGVIEKAELLEKEYPSSVFLIPTLIFKAEGYNYVQRYKDAEETINQVLVNLKSDDENYSKANYVLGEALYYQKKNKLALNAFYEAAKNKESKYYANSIYFAGKIFYEIKEYKKSENLLSFVIKNGTLYDVNVYEDSLCLLIKGYIENKKYKKAISLYEKIDANTFSTDFYNYLSFTVAPAYEQGGQPLKAYNIYCSLLECDDKNLVVDSLQNAYGVAHRNKIDFKPEEIVQKINNTSDEFDSILADFWTRMGVDSYNQQNFSKTKECFSYAKKNITPQTDIIIQIYEAKMKIDSGVTSDQARELIKSLQKLETLVVMQKDITVKDSYYSVIVNFKAIAGDWNGVVSSFTRIRNPDEHISYLGASGYYKNGNYAEADSTLQNCTSLENRLLLANVLAREEQYDKAANIYVQINSKGELDDVNRLEFAKVLYCQKKWEAAFKHSKTASQPISGYLCGLCAINLGKWQEAITSFDLYIKQYSKNYGYQDESYFYKAFAQYKLSNYQLAYKSFIEFLERKSINVDLNRRAYSLIAKSAIMLNDYQNASVYAEKLVKASTKEDEKQDALIFCSEIYSDSKQYDKAVKVLQPYTNGKSDFNLLCLYQIAQIYEKSKDINNADKYYEKVFTQFPKSKAAQEALYRCGELLYANENYEKAESRFTKYLNSFPDGKFCDAAYYFCGECNLNIKEYNRSIMQNKVLISKYPKSIYIYGAYSNLIKAYYYQENYGEALSIARLLKDEYPDQAEADGTLKKLVELEKITTGTDRRIVEKQTEYEKAGKKSTKKGRIAGSQLVLLYSEFGSLKDAYSIANEILPLQKDSSELSYAASNSQIIGEYYKSEGKNQQAAQMYLKAAEFYRSSSNDDKAALCLYSAVDSFVACQKRADAKETANLLIQLYPESKYAKNVNRLIK